MPLLAAVLALALAGCGADKEGKSKGAKASSGSSAAQVTSTGTGAASATASCQKVPQPKPRAPEKLKVPSLRLDPSATWVANLDTSCGMFAIKLDVKDSPKTTGSFASLARLGFYDGLTFHRIINGFVIQGGDPRGDGSGGPGYKTVEPPPSGTRYTRGTVAMAKQEIEDPGTAGSQFFIVTGDDAGLPADYALLGKVSSGQDTVDRIGVVGVDPSSDGRPLQPVLIRSVRVVEVKKKRK